MSANGPFLEMLEMLKKAKGMIGFAFILFAFILSIMVIDTRNKCVKSNNIDKYKNDTSLMYYIAIIILIGSIILMIV